jgi:AcrR family transcriptional regulator
MTAAPRLPAQERRAAIVASAIKVFSEKGFRGTTTRELAAAAGVSEPVIYHHFATKRDLYAAIIDSKSNDVARVVAELESYLLTDDDPGFFRHLAELILRYHDEDPAYLRLLLYSSLERHELSDLFHERHACAFENAVVRYMERRIEQGAFRSYHPAILASSFLGMVAHLGMHRMLNPGKPQQIEREQLIDGIVNIFLKGIQQ